MRKWAGVHQCAPAFFIHPNHTDMNGLPLTEVEAERLADCGQLAAYVEQLNGLYYEGFAEELREYDADAFMERFLQFINQ